jgi:hypothetical protein
MTGLKSAVTWVAALALSLVLVVLSIAARGWLAYGSPYAIPALARRQVVIARPGVIPAGQLYVDRQYRFAVDLINLSTKPVTVNGYQSKCTCVSVAESLPVGLPASGLRRISISVSPKMSQAGKPLAESIELYLSVPSAQTSISVEGTVARLAATP